MDIDWAAHTIGCVTKKENMLILVLFAENIKYDLEHGIQTKQKTNKQTYQTKTKRNPICFLGILDYNFFFTVIALFLHKHAYIFLKV